MNKPPRILIATPLYPPEIGGPATYSRLLEEELPRFGWELKILKFRDVRSWPRVIRHLIYTWRVLILSKGFDLIYVQDPVSVGLPVCLATFFARRGFILKIVGDYAWEQGSQRFGVTDLLDEFSINFKKYPWPVKLLKLVQTGVAKRADKIIVPSRYLKKIVSNWGVDPNKIIVIYNAFDQPPFLPDRESLRQELKLSGQVLVSAGRLVPWKGFSLLIEIVDKLKSNYPELKLLIFGSGPDKDFLQQKINKLGLADKIKLLGSLPQVELLKYIKASEAFVLNTSYEGFSHQLLEALWCGTPVVTTRVGGNPELIEDTKTGWLVEYDDSEGWRERIALVLSNKEQAFNIAKQGQERVKDFSKDRMINSLTKELP